MPKNATHAKNLVGLLQKICERLCENSTSPVSTDSEIKGLPLEFWSKGSIWISEDKTHLRPNFSFSEHRITITLYTDASQHAMAAVLALFKNGSERGICYASKSLSEVEIRHSTEKPEHWAIVKFTRHFKHYLLGRNFEIVTDHKALQLLHNFKDPDGLTARWLKRTSRLWIWKCP